AWARFLSNSPATNDNPRIPGGESCNSSDTKMLEGVDSLTFPMPRESESAFRLRAIVSDMLPLFSDDYSDDDVLTVRYLTSSLILFVCLFQEYITVIVCNGKSQRQARDYLEAFLGEKSGEFVACLWELLLKDFSQGKQENSASEQKTDVDFGSHDDDTLIEQGSSARGHNDYDHKATNWMNEKLISSTEGEDVETHASPKVKNLRTLRQELINSPCKRAQRKEKDDWNLAGVNYTRKILRSVVVSATKHPYRRNHDKYEKSTDKRSGNIQKRLSFPERERRQTSSQSARSRDVASPQEMKPHVSVWDRLSRPSSKLVLDNEYTTLPKFRIQSDENKAFLQHGPAFPAAYNEQRSEAFQRKVPAVGYRLGVNQSRKARQLESGAITYTEPHIAYNLNRKRRYGIINPSAGDDSVSELNSVLQCKQAKEDVEKPNLLSNQSAKPDIFSEILNMKQKLQQLEVQISQAKQLKKQKVGELKSSPQSGELQNQEDVTESRSIHVTNVHYAARKEAISMLFSKCGAVENVEIVTDPVTQHPKGAAAVTFATMESVNKAIALSNTMFYSRPIKVSRHGVMEESI
ncbi:unnamed protein product, partial [Microthlaspi erraticum]